MINKHDRLSLNDYMHKTELDPWPHLPSGAISQMWSILEATCEK